MTKGNDNYDDDSVKIRNIITSKIILLQVLASCSFTQLCFSKMSTNAHDDCFWYVKNFEEIWLDKYGYSSVVSLDYETFLLILSSSKLNIQSEYIVWQVIHDWVSFDKDTRLENLPKLIKNCLRFGCLDKHFIDVYIFNCELFISLPEVVQIKLKKFISNILKSNKQTTTYDFKLSHSQQITYFRPRKINQLLVCIDCIDGSAEYFDNQNSSWHSSLLSFKLPSEKEYFELELLGDDKSTLWAFGGRDENGITTNEVWSRDLSQQTSQWTAMTPMNQTRAYFSSVVLNDTIYALGGYSKENNSKSITLNSCECYNQQNIWKEIASMNTVRVDASATVYDGCIYIAGGYNEKDVVEKSVEKYDPQSNTWSQVAPMSTARFRYALTTFGGRIWAIGGNDGKRILSSVESYDPVNDCWREETSLNESQYLHKSIDFNNELYVVGGYFGNKTVEKYVTGKGWIKKSELQKGVRYPKLIILYSSCALSFTSEFS